MRTYKPVIRKVFNLKCKLCGKNYQSFYENKLTCSDECKKRKFSIDTGRLTDTSICSGTVGAISEMEVCAELMRKGYAVFRSLSPSCFCDAIAVKGEKILKIEIRTSYEHPTSKIIHYSKKLNKNERNTANIFGLYERSKKEVFFRDINGKEFVI